MVSVNHTLPSGPAVSAPTEARVSGRVNVVIWPAGVIRPMAGETSSAAVVNHRLPSGPAVMAPGPPMGEANSVTWPLGVMRPTVCATGSVNQTLPSEPAVMAVAPKLPPKLSGGRPNSEMVDSTQRSSRASTSGWYRTDFRRRWPPRPNNDRAYRMRDIKYLLYRYKPPDTRLCRRIACKTTMKREG